MPGRMKQCSLAFAAVSLRRGSTTTTLPPRRTMASSRPGASGAVIRLPLDARGLPPRISRRSVRSRSGTGMVRPPPNMSAAVTILGSWSAELAL